MSISPETRQILRDPVLLLAFGLGSGLAPRAPGTAGTLAAIVPYLWLRELPLGTYLGVLLAASLFGIWLCGEASRRLGVHDHGGIVWDEWVGLWLTLTLAPPGWPWIAVGFGLFRLFDIVKPGPIGWLDRRVEGGMGIMLDDLLAGVFALTGLWVLVWLLE